MSAVTGHARQVATEAVVAGAERCLDDPWQVDLWNQLPRLMRTRLVRANDAVERSPYDERAAVVYQARVTEAIAYLGSELQVAR